MESKQVTVSRIGGSWSSKDMERKMSFLEMVNWMNRYGYTVRSCYTGKLSGKRWLRYSKPDCNTEYQVSWDI